MSLSWYSSKTLDHLSLMKLLYLRLIFNRRNGSGWRVDVSETLSRFKHGHHRVPWSAAWGWLCLVPINTLKKYIKGSYSYCPLAGWQNFMHKVGWHICYTTSLFHGLTYPFRCFLQPMCAPNLLLPVHAYSEKHFVEH